VANNFKTGYESIFENSSDKKMKEEREKHDMIKSK